MLVAAALVSTTAMAGDPNCFGFPDRAFTKDNCVHICDPEPNGCGDRGLGLKTGMTVEAFELLDRTGKAVSLDKLVAEKPVFVEFGSFT